MCLNLTHRVNAPPREWEINTINSLPYRLCAIANFVGLHIF